MTEPITEAEARTLFESIIWDEGQADQLDAEATEIRNRAQDNLKKAEAKADEVATSADGLRWDAARKIHEALALGYTQQQVADKIDKDQKHVSRLNRVWKECGVQDLGPNPRTWPKYNTEYQRVKDTPDPEADVKRQAREGRREKVKELHDQNLSNYEIGKRLGIHEKTVRGDLNSYKPKPPEGDGEPTCAAVDTFPRVLKDFKEAGNWLIRARQVKEDKEAFDQARMALNKLIKELDKIERKHHDNG